MNRTEALLFRTIVCLSGAVIFSSASPAQSPETTGTLRHEVFTSSVAEDYLRYLQSAGKVPDQPWSSRPFSSRELARMIPKDSAHPWSDRFTDISTELGGLRYGLISPEVSFRLNSGFPYGSNDGPIWAGRGLTTAATAGFYVYWKWASLTVAPMAFSAQNASFDLAPSGGTGNAVFRNPDFGGIDLPQRFGNSMYSQVDPGQTTLRIDLPYVTAGVSTANMGWGPAQYFPILLGNNAAGFPHAFVGTSEPLDIYVAKIQAKMFWGELFQSDFSSVTGSKTFLSRAEPGTKRFATGLIAIVQPRGLNGLEIGGARFFHSIWPSSGIPRSYLTKALQGILKKDVAPDSIADPRFPPEAVSRGIADNQLISVFARWVLPHSGFEIHTEYGRDDHSYDFRDLNQEIDHSRIYSFGARKVFSSNAEKLTAGRFEILNFQLPQLSRYRGEGEIYVHGLLRQGHTYKGQMLGANAGVGTGAGSIMAVDRFTRGGRWTASWTRIVRRENGDYTAMGIRTPRSIDVSHALGFERAAVYRGFEVTTGLTLVRELNRDFLRDATNVNALVGLRYLMY
ncbi:MAG TPA: hypothetical protein VF042_01345 [Gemmatimonadaceae bacterium]